MDEPMSTWSDEFEQDLTHVLKDWLKHQGRTQADLRRNLRAVSTRMPALLEVLEQEHQRNGLPGLATRLCLVEAEWQGEDRAPGNTNAQTSGDPFSQLDMLLQEIREDCPS